MENVRIDKGIKRGPKKQRVAIQRPQESQDLSPIIPITLDPKEVLERYLSEAKTSKIAESYGVRRRNLVRWLREVAPAEWKQVQVVRALIFKEDGMEAMEEADSALVLARAREMVRTAQWELERQDAANYAPKQELTVEVIGDLGDKLRRAKERVIEGESQRTIEPVAALPQNVSPDTP